MAFGLEKKSLVLQVVVLDNQIRLKAMGLRIIEVCV